MLGLFEMASLVSFEFVAVASMAKLCASPSHISASHGTILFMCVPGLATSNNNSGYSCLVIGMSRTETPL